ncbi:MAG: hypothetical protein JO165_12925 [Candidatus Eremiobacteraeota bacterium]|nr:hypothetical protein [Candidatus Eremiobacteraeota bacterium]
MSPRVEPDSSLAVFTPAAHAAGIAAIVPDDELETTPLPREHPKWVRDALLVSQRARQALSRIEPAIVRVLSFWDHAIRSVRLGGNRSLTVDSSGSYKIEYHS